MLRRTTRLYTLVSLVAFADGFTVHSVACGASNGAARASIHCGTCRVCLSSFDEKANGPEACRFHPGSLRGESARKGNWEGERGPDSGSGGDLVYTYTCCGKEKGAPGCVLGRHVGFGE